MKVHLPIAAALLGIVLLPSEVLAASEVEHGHSWGMLALQVLNLTVLVLVLLRYTRKPLADFFKQRSLEVGAQIHKAEQALTEAESELAGVRERLAAIDREKAEFLAEAEAIARAEAQRHLERANEMSVRIQEDARRVANQEIARARYELQAEAAELATRLAGGILREKLTSDDDRRLVSEFIDQAGADS